MHIDNSLTCSTSQKPNCRRQSKLGRYWQSPTPCVQGPLASPMPICFRLAVHLRVVHNAVGRFFVHSMPLGEVFFSEHVEADAPIHARTETSRPPFYGNGEFAHARHSRLPRLHPCGVQHQHVYDCSRRQASCTACLHIAYRNGLSLSSPALLRYLNWLFVAGRVLLHVKLLWAQSITYNLV